MTITALKETIEKIEGQFKNADALDSRAISNMRKELFENFKLTSFTNSQERQENWNQLQLLMDALKDKQVLLDRESEKFAAEA